MSEALAYPPRGMSRERWPWKGYPDEARITIQHVHAERNCPSMTKILKSIAVILYVAGTIWFVRWFVEATGFSLIWFSGFIGLLFLYGWAVDRQDAKKARRQHGR